MDDLALKYFRALVLSHTTHTGEIGIQLKIKRWGSVRPSEARDLGIGRFEMQGRADGQSKYQLMDIDDLCTPQSSP